MGRRILVQRRGRGGQNFRSPAHKKRGEVKHPHFEKDENLTGKLIDFIHEGGRGTPIGKLEFAKGKYHLWLPPEGVFIGETFEFGVKTDIKVGNTMQIQYIPEGMLIYNIEGKPGDGGKIARAAGSFCILQERTPKGAYMKLPSGNRKMVNLRCLATIGVVAGGGVATKPVMKAGAKHYLMKTKATTWPRVRGVAMNAASHPHGGGSKQSPGRPSTVARDTPPGRKVGLIAARQTGRKRGRQK